MPSPLHATIEEFAAEGYTHVECFCPRCRIIRMRPMGWLPRISMGSLSRSSQRDFAALSAGGALQFNPAVAGASASYWRPRTIAASKPKARIAATPTNRSLTSGYMGVLQFALHSRKPRTLGPSFHAPVRAYSTSRAKTFKREQRPQSRKRRRLRAGALFLLSVASWAHDPSSLWTINQGLLIE